MDRGGHRRVWVIAPRIASALLCYLVGRPSIPLDNGPRQAAETRLLRALLTCPRFSRLSFLACTCFSFRSWDLLSSCGSGAVALSPFLLPSCKRAVEARLDAHVKTLLAREFERCVVCGVCRCRPRYAGYRGWRRRAFGLGGRRGGSA